MERRTSHPGSKGLETGFGARRALGLALLMFKLTCFGPRVFAHDPFELTGTVSFFSNRLELVVVMPPRTAMRLAESDGRQAIDLTQPGEFEEMLPRLRVQAGRFWRINGGGTNSIPIIETHVSEVEEAHVQFQCVTVLPPSGLVHLEADGLRRLPDEDPYGLALLVLDRVNAGVLADAVLWAESPMIDVRWGGLPVNPDETTKGWKQVAGFLVLLSAIGLVIWAARRRNLPSS
jgi:hypothetical protein